MGRGGEVVGIDNLDEYYAVSLKQARLDRCSTAPTRASGSCICTSQTWLARVRSGRRRNRHDRPPRCPAWGPILIENPHAYAHSNLVGHLNLLELARRGGVGHMVYASSSSVYGGNSKVPFSVEDRVDHPVSLYAATKKADELMSETYAHLTGCR